MTEKNIEQLIGVVMILGMFYYFFSLARLDSRPNSDTHHKNIATEKSNWDKLSNVSKFIAAIAALLFAIKQFYEVFGKK